jgi:parallel beta-helix repeat protein
MKWFVVVLLLLAGVVGSIGLLTRPGAEASPDATITVNSNADTDQRDGVVTLREAILLATHGLPVADLDPGECDQVSNSTYGARCSTADTIGAGSADAITFDATVFPGDTPAAINLGGPLPPLDTGNDVVDGSSAGVVLDGLYRWFDCLQVTSNGNSVKGLQIHDCDCGVRINDGAQNNTVGGTTEGDRNVLTGSNDGVCIHDDDTSDNFVIGNYIGTDPSGSYAIGNGHGVAISGGAHNNTIGGDSTAGKRNVISGNNWSGVDIHGDGTDDNFVIGNYIGTDATAVQPDGHPIPNGQGVAIYEGAQGNVIGSDSVDERNVISGNSWSGVSIWDASTNGNTVKGNFIGTDANGDNGMGNGAGVQISNGARNNTIGGDSTAGKRNVISANSGSGVGIWDASTNDNVVSGNYIGTDANGNNGMGNGTGVQISNGASNNTIGGTSEGERNVISANIWSGVGIADSGTNGNTVKGNYIGTDAGGSGGLGNSGGGVNICCSARGNTIGGSTTAGEGNVISANHAEGVWIGNAGTNNNAVIGNYIGTDADGTAPMGNDRGVWIGDGAEGNTVGGGSSNARNIISANGWQGVMIWGSGSKNNKVQGNYIGTDRSGALPLGNGSEGVVINGGAHDNTIGGSTTAGEGNVISGSQNGPGVSIADDGTNNNKVQGNYIGTDANGTTALPNRGGVNICCGAQNNTVGGSTAAGEGNIISGSQDAAGVSIGGEGTTNNKVQGNYIGTNASGTAAIPNNGGVNICCGAQDNTVGSSSASERNVISGNDGSGVWIGNGGTNGNTVKGNYIGTNVGGTAALPNGGGVNIDSGAQDNIIGGSTSGERNVVSGNNGSGVWIGNGGTNGNTVKGNYIGTNAGGTAALPNGGGVNIESGAQDNIIGGSTSGERNVISGNNGSGVWIGNGDTNSNVVKGNYIGTNAGGTAALPNNGGVNICCGAQSNTVGGTTIGERNIISGNNWSGVWISDGGTNGNVVRGNYIGTDLSGTAALPNDTGVNLCCGAEENTIGGSTPEERNIISSNVGDGVSISGGHNQVTGNYIGTDISGTIALPNNNGMNICCGAYENTIGGTAPGERNVISGNGARGVNIDGGGTNNNVVSGNYIGTDASGIAALPNQVNGVVLINGPNNNQIGGPTPEERNIISGNNGFGVEIWFEGTNNNLVEGNYIGLNAAGAPLGDQYSGVYIYNGADNNTLRGNVISDNGGPGVRLDGMPYRLSSSPTEYEPIAIDDQLEVVLNGQTVFLEITGSGSVHGPRFQAMRGDALEVRASSTDDGCGSIGPVWLTHIGTEDGSVQLTAGKSGCGPGGLFWSTTYVLDIPEYDWIASWNAIEGNRIGTNAAGDAAMPNNGPGVELGRGASDTLVGVNQEEGRGSPNLISGNNGDGVRIQGSWNNHIGANDIGTDLSGSFALPNHGPGIHMQQGARNNTAMGNVISGNEGDGVQLEHEGTNWNRINGNRIGVDAAGTAAIPNWGNGVTIDQGASGNSIGGGEEWERNVITGNQGWGVRIAGAQSESNLVYNNYIGLDAAGMPGLPSSGVSITNGASQNSVYGNVISDNKSPAITVGGLEYVLNASETGGELRGIVLDDRLEILVNGQTVFLDDSDGGQIWAPGFSAVPGDTIEVRASDMDGGCGSIGPVWLYHVGSWEGVQLTPGAAGCGGTFWSTTLTLDFPAEGWITEGTWIGNNRIGTSPAGDAPMPNDGHGVDIRGASHGASISNNTIAFNEGDGVHIDASTGNEIWGNSIHSNAGKGIENVNGGNNEVPPPVLTGGGSVTGLACPYCWVQIFSDQEDEGAIYEGSTMVAADGTFVFPGTPSGPYITATVTDGEGNTSEFSDPMVPVIVRMESGYAAPGGSVTLTLETLNIPDPGLGAFTIEVSYDPSIIAPTAFAPGPGFDSVVCNLAYASDTVRCTGVHADAGAVGDLALADLTFQVDAGAVLGSQSPLAVAVVTLANVDDQAIGADTKDGAITVGLHGNVNCDGDVDAVDALFILQYVVGMKQAGDQCPPPPGALYLPAADVNCDNDVDAVDALFVLQYVVGLRPELGVCR